MASTHARTLANRRNSRHSTGPKTAAGKARSAANSLKHGLTGEGLCLPVEDSKELDVRLNSLQDELNPATEQELFYTRRLALLTLRVDRCYVKETFNLRMAVRDAIPNHDRKIFEEVRAIVSNLPADPFGSVERLKRTAQGVDWMVNEWHQLREALIESGDFNSVELTRAEQLQGRRHDATGLSRFQELNRLTKTGLECVAGELRAAPDQVAACMARSRLEFEALLGRQIEQLLIHRSTLPLAEAEQDRLEAPMRAMIDVTHSGQLLRRYETAAAREIHKIYAYFDEKRAAEASENLGATPEISEESAELSSSGNPPDPGIAEAVPEVEAVSEIVVATPEITPTSQVEPLSESPDHLARSFRRPSRE